MRIGELSSPAGATHRRKRVGCGIGSGHGKTCCRGHKGQKARDTVPPRFEGGQTPLQRQMRKLGGISKSAMPRGMLSREYAVVNVGQLERFDGRTPVTAELMLAAGVIKATHQGVRVLGMGEITKPLHVLAAHFTASARAKIEGAGGQAEVV